MFKECPKCQGRMVTLADGYFCLTCGRTFPLTSQPRTHGEEPSQPPAPSEALQGHHIIDPIPTPELKPIVPALTSSPQAIINHHAASYAKRRLQADVARLEDTPELPSSLDPDREIEAPDQPYAALIASDEPTRDAVANTQLPEVGSDEPETNDKPVKPSAFVVHATQPLYETPHPLQSIQPQVGGLSAEEQLLADARALSAERPAKLAGDPTKEKAEALLAAASQKQPASKSRTWILAGISLFILVGAGVGAWLLLMPARSDKPATTPVPVTTTTPTPSPSIEPAKRDTQRKSDLNSIAIGLEAYHKATGAYPVGSDISILSPLEKTAPPFINRVNLDPSSTEGTPIKYSYSSDGSSFTLSASLENAKDPDAKDGLYVVRNKNQ